MRNLEKFRLEKTLYGNLAATFSCPVCFTETKVISIFDMEATRIIKCEVCGYTEGLVDGRLKEDESKNKERKD